MNVADSAEKALRMARESSLLVYDTETSGLDYRKNYPIGYVVGTNPNDVVYVPIRHGGGGNLPDPNTGALENPNSAWQVSKWEKEFAKALATNSNVKIVGHNMMFDALMSWSAGIKLGRNLICTQNTQALLNEYQKSYSLDECAKIHGVSGKLGGMLYEHLATKFGTKNDKKSMSEYWRLAGNDAIGVEYAIGDGVTTYELYRSQLKMIETQELNTIYNLENGLIWTLVRMRTFGIKVDIDYLRQTKTLLEQKVENAKNELPPGFNPRSPNDMKKLMTEAGRTDWPTTELGNPSFEEKWLKGFPEGQRVVSLRKYSNLINTFIMPLMEEHSFNGRVNAQLNQLKGDDAGTISGRFSCSFPNLQQIPKRDKELAPMFRRAFVADEGHLLYEGDQSQAEPRLFAHYSKDPNLLAGYNSEPFVDMHQVTANLLNVERDPRAKRMNMGILTGMQKKTFASHMGLTYEEASRMFDQWMEAYPTIAKFQDQAKRVLINRGYIKTLLGRRGRLDQPRFAYKAVSKIIQGGNADIIKYKILEIDKWLESIGDPVRLLMTVHDSLLWQAPDTEEGRKLSVELIARLEDVMSPPFNLSVPFLIDWDCGINWKEATFGKD
jgi:DNA polymerase I-like protein with 3'-5' exonuclease and polymerase domains